MDPKPIDLEELLRKNRLNAITIIIEPIHRENFLGQEESVEIISPTKIISCPICMMNFRLQSDLKVHLLSHSETN